MILTNKMNFTILLIYIFQNVSPAMTYINIRIKEGRKPDEFGSIKTNTRPEGLGVSFSHVPH